MTAPARVPLPVRIEAAGDVLDGDLCVPEQARGLVIFAHGSGSSRHSSRNISVADVLQREGLGTLLLDLLTEHEERTDAVTAEFRFDIPLLASRVATAITWAQAHPETERLPLGLFGASTGAHRRTVGGSDERGGRPDLAEDALARVTAPTLLIVGGRDDVVIELNRLALERLYGPKEMQIVPGATHLFEEPGALAQVARLAADWFQRHLGEAGRG